ncbi:UNVERIFIED_CONTAM: hypothetical protein GTU68_037175 [Idotea baltica]|nr:hypothetical protein [Idotea baltica]
MKILCIGRNYADHAKELNNEVPTSPMIFMKPSSALLVNNKPLYYPSFTEELHYEVEAVIRICKNGRHVQRQYAPDYYDQIGIGIDFTARDIQARLKAKGHPWELAKAFDGSAALSQMVPLDSRSSGPQTFSLTKNDEQVQLGTTADMIFSFEDIICYASQYFKLQIGDLIYTGTPAGVGAVIIGDHLEAFLGDQLMLKCAIK